MPVNLPAVNASLSGTATVNVTNHIDVTGLVQTIMSQVKGAIEGAFNTHVATNGDSGFDGRSNPSYPDHFHGGGH
jgi:hypothetical protein